jgi:hypothetical protein
VDFHDRVERAREVLGGEAHADGEEELHVGDPKYDDWDVVRDFGDLETARAFRQNLAERGQSSVLTADHPLDQFGRGDIALRVPPGAGLSAEKLLDDPG